MIKMPLPKALDDLSERLERATLAKYFEWFCQEIRGAGNTAAAIRACKSENATLLCATSLVAEEIAKKHNIHTGAMGIVAAPREKKTIIDPDCVYALAREARELEELARTVVGLAKQKGVNR